MEEDKVLDTPKIIDEKYIEELKAHCEACKKATEYAITRFDILIIALSSGAVAFSAGFIKDFVQIDDQPNFLVIKISWVLFGAAIIFNFVSQITSYYSHRIEIKIIGSLIKKERGRKALPNEAQLECQKHIYNKGTNLFNSISFFSFIIGVIFLIIFMFNHF